MSNEVLRMWTVYYNPSDYPGRYVARMHVVGKNKNESGPTDQMFTGDSLEEIRGLIPYGLVCLTRQEGDDSSIVETWL
jgi:hypothetical protein